MTSDPKLSRYQISEKIGEGSMGEAFLAHDPSLDRPVVLRFLPDKLPRGAKAAALDHPYICKIYEIAEDEGKPFIAMEYVRGQTLEKRLARGRLPLADAIGIATEIAEALETAHEKGIVHGDLTPSSIMLTEGDHVRVMDFGLKSAPNDDPRSDIFSFGLVLEEMADSGASDLLANVVAKMLAKDPGDRYQRVHDVRIDLARVGKRSAASRTRTPAAATAVALLVVGVWFLIDAMTSREPPSVAVLPLRNISDDPLESDYVAEGISQAVIARLTQAGLQVTPWETARRYGDTDDPPEIIAGELNVDNVLFGSFHLADERILASLSLIEADSGVLSWAEEFEAPYENIFQMQRQIAVRAATSLRSGLSGEEEEALAAAESMSVDAYDFYLQGAYLIQDGTQEATEIAFEYFDQAVALDPDLAEAHLGLASVHYERYFLGWGGGLESLDRAEASYDRALQLKPNSMKARIGLVNVHFQRGHIEACLIEGREAARFGRPHDVETLLTRGAAYHLGGFRDRASTLFREALEIDPVNQEAQWRLVATTWFVDSQLTVETGSDYLRRFGDDPEIHMYVANAHHHLGNTERARKHYEQAMGLPAQNEPEAELAAGRAADAFPFAGFLHEQIGEHDRAMEVWQLGAEVFERKLEVSPDNPYVSLMLAGLYGLLGDEASMLAMEERGLSGPYASPWEVHILAAVHEKQGETERAVELLRQSLRRGLIDPAWEPIFRLADVAVPQSEAFDRFVEGFRSEERRLRETY